jgi:uncharacterized protein YyaL (SSP411 family)
MTCTTRRLAALLTLVLAFALLATLPAAAPPAKHKPARAKKPNRLARESSPYLLQHAHNPVDWYPWGPEAFARAKKEKKLVFLSIGYSSCHWCHVMEKESFANKEVAKILNDHFVCIKVDREERPDVDQVYMTALTLLTSRGGWPLSMWLTADGKPIVGGTYWPREDQEDDGKTYRGFKSLLLLMHKLHKDNPKDLQEQAEKVAKATTAELAGVGRGVALIALDRSLVEGVVEALKEEFDKAHGGFGNPRGKFRGTKFPMPPHLVFLQGEAARAKDRALDEMARITLDHMARGGIYDHLGGGFHRYSTERTWTVPHFEKMLYDNAQLLEVYARAYRQKKKPQDARVLRQTIDFVAREMTSPEGGFYSALDADSEEEEGRFYVWTARELNTILKDKAEAKLLRQVYGADEGYNFEGKYHILRLPKPLAEAAKGRKTSEDKLEAKLVPLRARLFAARARRPRPFLDTKVLTAWNGQMIAGLARAGEALGDRKAIAAAEKAAGFVLAKLRAKDGRLLRTYGAAPGSKAAAKLNGYLDDYAYLVHGLLALHDVTRGKRWLAEAKALTATMVKHHADTKSGGFFYTSNDHEKLFARAKDQYDGVQPAGNTAAARNLVQLWLTTGDAKYQKEAERTFKALAPALKSSPSNLCGLAEALGVYLEAKARKK